MDTSHHPTRRSPAAATAARRQGRTARTTVRMAVISLVLLLGLAIAGVSAQAYRSENRALHALLADLTAQEGWDDAAQPTDLMAIARQASALETDLNSLQSYLQPFTETLASGGWCGNYVRVFVEHARAQGYKAQKVHLRSGDSSHQAAEVFEDGAWRVYDPFFGRVFPTADGSLATFAQLATDPAIAAAGEVVAPAGDPGLEVIYRDSYARVYHRLYADAMEFQWSPSPSALFHDFFVVLAYPLDPFVDGPRRPVIPHWLDRPELLGAYLGVALALGAVAVGVRSKRRN